MSIGLPSKFIVSLITFYLLLAGAETGTACSTVTSPASPYMGKNFDWFDQHVMVVAQPSGAHRTSVDLHGSGRSISWDVRYANTTLTQFGPGLPYEGMNEAGLAIQILWLSSSAYEETDPTDERPVITELEWIQYHLDNYASLDEIFADMEELTGQRPTAPSHSRTYRQTKIRLAPAFAKVHFFVCDRSQDCATFEWLDHRLVVHRINESLAPQALANSPYQDSLHELGRNMNTRFTRLGTTRLSRDFWSSAEMFDLLDVASQSNTVWQSVFLQDQGKVIIEHRGSQKTLHTDISLARADGGCHLPLMQWAALDLASGDWHSDSELLRYSREQHTEVLRVGLTGLNLQDQYPIAEIQRRMERSYNCTDHGQ